MTIQRQVTFWIVGLAILIGSLYILREILLPFVAGMTLAYCLDPVADWLEKVGLPRIAATGLILGLFLLLFVLALVLMVPVLAEQLEELAKRFPGYLASLKTFITGLGDGWLNKYIDLDSANIEETLQNFAGTAVGWVAKIMKSAWSGGMALVNFLALLVVTPVVAFYVLNDWDRMVARIDGWLPRAHAPAIRQITSDIDTAIAGFVRGQGMVCLLLGLFYAIGLSLVGLHSGLLIGIGAGVISFIPYVGSTVGLIVSAGVALVQFWPDWIPIVTVLGIFFAGQFLEGNILQPKLVGKSVGLHPVWLMFALFAFGYLFGFVGMLLAVPLASAIGVLVRFTLGRYLQSQLYTAGAPAEEPGSDAGGSGRKE